MPLAYSSLQPACSCVCFSCLLSYDAILPVFLLSSASFSFCLLSSSKSCFLSSFLFQLAFFFRLLFLLPVAYSCSFLLSMPSTILLLPFHFTETLRLALLLWRASPGFVGSADFMRKGPLHSDDTNRLDSMTACFDKVMSEEFDRTS